MFAKYRKRDVDSDGGGEKDDKRKDSEEGGGVKNKMESLLIRLFINVPFRLR